MTLTQQLKPSLIERGHHMQVTVKTAKTNQKTALNENRTAHKQAKQTFLGPVAEWNIKGVWKSGFRRALCLRHRNSSPPLLV